MSPKLSTVTASKLSTYYVPGGCKPLRQGSQNFLCFRFTQTAGKDRRSLAPPRDQLGGAPKARFKYALSLPGGWFELSSRTHTLGNKARGDTEDLKKVDVLIRIIKRHPELKHSDPGPFPIQIPTFNVEKALQGARKTS